MGTYLLIVCLLKEEYLEDVVLALTETGASGAVVVDAQNMQRMMAFNIPIFAGFREELGQQPGYAKVVLSQVSGKEDVDRFLAALAEGGTDFQKDELGRLLLLPLALFIDPQTREES